MGEDRRGLVELQMTSSSATMKTKTLLICSSFDRRSRLVSTFKWAGQFVVIAWPFTEQATSKRHPALVLDEPNANGDLRYSRSPVAVITTLNWR